MPVVVAIALLDWWSWGAVKSRLHRYGIDFAVYRTAGRAVLHDHALYGPWVGRHLARPLPFTYPPMAALVESTTWPVISPKVCPKMGRPEMRRKNPNTNNLVRMQVPFGHP